jgi:hypothetical protein
MRLPTFSPVTRWLMAAPRASSVMETIGVLVWLSKPGAESMMLSPE